MNDKKVITNVWINKTDNQLFCADVYFSDKVDAIIPRNENIYEWTQLTDFKNKNKIYSKKSTEDFPSSIKVYDGKFNLLMPGAIDAHVHFNTPGFEEREDFEHGTLAAAFGGVTTVIDMPCTSLPPVTSIDHLHEKLNIIKDRSYIDFALWGGIRGNDFDEIDIEKQILGLAEAGIVGFKVYMISGMDTFKDLTFEQIYQVAEWIKPTGLPMAVHAEKKKNIVLKEQEYKKQNKNNWEHYCDARNFISEGEAVAEMMNVAKITGCPVHIVHLSSEFGLGIIEKAQSSGIPISAETCPHYLHFTLNSFKDKNISSFLKTAPPVKQLHDKDALWIGLKNNIISFVTTDHAGCDPQNEKVSENFWEIYGGIPGVEHRVPFLFSEGFLTGVLSLEQTINLLSANVARFYGLTSKGNLAKNSDADFALINLWEKGKISSANMHCKGKYTPFENMEFKAVVEDLFLRGEHLIKNKKRSINKPGFGQIVRRNSV